MGISLTLPRLVFGTESIESLSTELSLLGVERPLLLSDRGLEAAGLVAAVQTCAPRSPVSFLDIPENPTAAGADAAFLAFERGRCDGIVALGGGSVLDTAKIVSAMAGSGMHHAADIIGKPQVISRAVPLVAIPTTIGTGSESSPVAALHLKAGGPGIGTRHTLLVPKIALCDPALTRTLPPRLVAATAIDALSHCIEGFFANPVHPFIDVIALDGIRRVFDEALAALEPGAIDARASLMAAAFAGGAAIHKGLGPAHAVALVCGDQDVHHGTLIAVVLPHSTRLLARHVPEKAALIRRALDLDPDSDLGDALHDLTRSLGLPETLEAARYDVGDRSALASAMALSHFNRTSPYTPTEDDYRYLLSAVTD